MSLKPRSRSIKQTTKINDIIPDTKEDVEVQKPFLPPPPAVSRRSIITQTLASTGNLANLLPTGTVLAFQLLIPTLTNNGSCDPFTSLLTHIFLILLAASCFLASFTDSIKCPDGQVYYGLVTFKGLWLLDYPPTESSTLPDLTKYKLRFIDGVHAVLSVLVFVVVALRDKNVLSCFYPQPKHEIQQILNIIPMTIGIICSSLFVIFPTRRHGIGYPVSTGR